MEGKGKKEQGAINVWDCGSNLYDSYEIASIGHLIDRHSLALSSPCGPEKEGRVVIDYASMPRDQEKGLQVKKEGLRSRIIRIFFWKRRMIKERKDRKVELNTSSVQKVRDHAPVLPSAESFSTPKLDYPNQSCHLNGLTYPNQYSLGLLKPNKPHNRTGSTSSDFLTIRYELRVTTPCFIFHLLWESHMFCPLLKRMACSGRERRLVEERIHACNAFGDAGNFDMVRRPSTSFSHLLKLSVVDDMHPDHLAR
ncbi:hypothetical protein DKX38_000683 [Salix brachista]|uniref:Uncharacterized protein n=1 Tax=Salix brachista TaxID=2182728 RepID=A0A5N5P241_9ROSI|nr:hypothetical protein DKX38_000683 [Salix brachista]